MQHCISTNIARFTKNNISFLISAIYWKKILNDKLHIFNDEYNFISRYYYNIIQNKCNEQLGIVKYEYYCLNVLFCCL